METFQNGATGVYAQPHAEKVWEEEQETVPIHYFWMVQSAQESTQSKKFVTKDNVQVP